MIGMVDLYLDANAAHDPSRLPLAKKVKFTENGQHLDLGEGLWSCLEQFKSGLLHFVSLIRDRRYVAVDPEHGLVFSFIFFDHNAGNTRTFTVPDGRTVTAGPKQPWTWEIAEIFKIEHGQIRQIQAIMERAPFGMNSGWSTREQGRSDAARYLDR